MKKKLLISILSIGLIILPFNVSALEGDPLDPVVEQGTSDLVIVANNQTLKVNESKVLNFEIEGEDSDSYALSFFSENPLIVSITSQNEIATLKGVSVGKTRVSIVLTFEDPAKEDIVKSVEVTVEEVPAKLSFTESERYVTRKSKFKVLYTLEAGSTGSDIIWQSSKPEVASVVNGVVEAHRVGSTTISARVGDVVVKMEVYVTVPLQRIEFNPKTLKVRVSETVNLPSLIYIPYDTTAAKKPTYKVDSPDIISLENGKITGLKPGTTTIIASIKDVTTTLVIEVVLDENVSNTYAANFFVKMEDENFILLTNDAMTDYKVGKVDIKLDVEAILAYMNNREVTRVKLVFDERLSRNQFALMNSIELPKDLFLLLGAQKLEVEILDHNYTTWAKFFFNSRSKEPLDILFSVHEIGIDSNLMTHTQGQKAFEMNFGNKNGFPYGTYVQLNTSLFKNNLSDYYFLYESNDHGLVYDNQQASPDADTVMFSIDSANYVVTFNKLTKGQDTTLLYALIGLVVVLFASIGYIRFKQVRKRS